MSAHTRDPDWPHRDPAVLVVEDDPAIGQLLRIALTDAGLAVTLATDVGSARAELAVDTPRVVVLDLRLGEEDGMAILEELAGAPGGPAVIVVTAEVGARERVLVAGAADHVAKPFDVTELVGRVTALAEHEDRPRQSD